MLAPSFDDVLVNAPRAIVVSWDDQGSGLGGRIGPRLDHTGAVTFDADAALAFNHRLPLDRLVEAATKSILPQGLRRRVAIAAFTRALLLNREDTAVGLAPLLSTLAPALRADLDRYTAAATPTDRRRAGLLLLTRTPGMRTMVAGPDDDFSYAVVEPVKKFDHLLRRTWWCGTEIDQSRSHDEVSESVALLYPSGDVPYPAFLTDSDRAVVERELEALRAIGPARSYLARETIAWARATPQDANVAEALALVVEGWRWNCGDNDQWTLARQAFRILHGQYPQSEWARKTRYWYR
jgi:hypothetical protein